jgi:DNA primase
MMTIEQYLFQMGRDAAIRCGNNWYYRCPLHDDSVPSFHLTRDRQLWKCHGCNEGGTVVKLICLLENVSWREAYQILAGENHIPPAKPATNNKADQLTVSILSFFTNWWHEQLFANSARYARLYVYNRGVDNEIMDNRLIGYAPWDGDGALVRRIIPIVQEQFGWHGLDRAEKLGIFVRNEYSDLRFQLQNRIMFSCLDLSKPTQTVYYQGRAVEPSKSKYKVIGPKGIPKSPFWLPIESPLYQFSIVTEAAWGPATLAIYRIAAMATLGQGIKSEHLKYLPAPRFFAQDNDEAGDKQAAKCMQECDQAYRLRPPAYSKKENGLDDWLVRGGIEEMLRVIDVELGLTL